jgi:hypothetical protein
MAGQIERVKHGAQEKREENPGMACQRTWWKGAMLSVVVTSMMPATRGSTM